MCCKKKQDIPKVRSLVWLAVIPFLICISWYNGWHVVHRLAYHCALHGICFCLRFVRCVEPSSGQSTYMHVDSSREGDQCIDIRHTMAMGTQHCV